MIKNYKDNRLYKFLLKWRIKYEQLKTIKEWGKNGRPVPPPHIIKQRNLIRYAEKYQLKILVETGTYSGDMIEAMKGHFAHIYSIELEKVLCDRARERFKKESHIELIHGDSGRELGKVINKLNHPALFWLDGHYSGGETAMGEKETPIYEELRHVLADCRSYVIIIDDARLFGSDPAYPSLPELEGFIRAMRPEMKISVADDSIRVEPNGLAGPARPEYIQKL